MLIDPDNPPRCSLPRPRRDRWAHGELFFRSLRRELQSLLELVPDDVDISGAKLIQPGEAGRESMRLHDRPASPALFR